MRIICCTGSDNNETRIGSATVAGAILGLLVIGAAVGGLGLKLWDGSHARLARDQARRRAGDPRRLLLRRRSAAAAHARGPCRRRGGDE